MNEVRRVLLWDIRIRIDSVWRFVRRTNILHEKSPSLSKRRGLELCSSLSVVDPRASLDQMSRPDFCRLNWRPVESIRRPTLFAACEIDRRALFTGDYRPNRRDLQTTRTDLRRNASIARPSRTFLQWMPIVDLGFSVPIERSNVEQPRRATVVSTERTTASIPADRRFIVSTLFG